MADSGPDNPGTFQVKASVLSELMVVPHLGSLAQSMGLSGRDQQVPDAADTTVLST